MRTKDKLLTLFEENKGAYFSGEELAERLSVSRAAVWKAVNSLRAEGYELDAVQNRGYCLSERSDILSAQGIAKYLQPACAELNVTVLPSATSTNALVRLKAEAGAPEGLTVLANAQTEGRGRLGRRFFSPTDTGLYMSLLLRPRQWPAGQAVKLTTMAAVAACEAIEEVSDVKAAIKWVNDIYVNGKKVSGILTEAAVAVENGFLDYAVVGIGINLYPPEGGFPDELKERAGTVFDRPQSDGKNRLAAAFLNRFMTTYAGGDDYAERYRSRSLAIGKRVTVLLPAGSRQADVLDVDADCRLVVRYVDGTVEKLSSGEISIALPVC